jgi:hypothetical protein
MLPDNKRPSIAGTIILRENMANKATGTPFLLVFCRFTGKTGDF